MSKVSPPGYRKRNNSRVLWTVLRKDQYKIDGDFLTIKGLGAIGPIKVRYAGKIHVRGEQGRAEIHYDRDAGRWYIHTSFEVSEKAVREKWIKAPLKPLGSKVAGIDIGVNNLLAVYVEDSSALLVSGRPLKSISFYWRNKIAQYQSIINKYGIETSRRIRLMFKRWRRQITSFVNWAVRNTIEWFHKSGVSTVVVGYPKYVAQNCDRNSKVNFLVTHVWTYGYLLRRIVEIGEEYGIRVEFIKEENTSTTCPLCRVKDDNHRRIYRGLFKCHVHNEVFNADLVGAFNIALKIRTISPSPALSGIGVTRLRPGAWLNPNGDVATNLLETRLLARRRSDTDVCILANLFSKRSRYALDLSNSWIDTDNTPCNSSFKDEDSSFY